MWPNELVIKIGLNLSEFEYLTSPTRTYYEISSFDGLKSEELLKKLKEVF